MKKQKGQTLILVPEVAMLHEYTGMGTLYYAGLKQSEKKEIWSCVQEEKIQVIIGTQKALFLPFKNLTKIIINEEQYETHKLWDQYPRLHTVRGAEMLAKIWGAKIIYSSSYPSIRLRFLQANKSIKPLTNKQVQIKTTIIPFSFEDRKWKRAFPNDAGTTIRAWARQGKKVLVLYNKKDNQKIKEVLFFRLSKKAKESISLGTTSLLTDAVQKEYDRVVWIAPELTMRAIDYRSSERARILAARLQSLTPKFPVTIVTRNFDLTQQTLGVSDAMWYEKVLKERRLLHLPPYTDLVRLTVRDKSIKKAHTRADNVFTLLQSALEKFPATRAFGPYEERSPKKSKLFEWHILISGELSKAVEAYKNLPIDSADIDPQRIV
ncbi:MAG: hypothetical protein O3A36_00610 [bacterium]|nr:hypothetical protein [bacterium]